MVIFFIAGVSRIINSTWLPELFLSGLLIERIIKYKTASLSLIIKYLHKMAHLIAAFCGWC